MIRRALAPLALLLFLALPSAAWATPKVALTAIEGDSEGDVRDAVADALDGDDLKLIGKKEVNRAVDKLGDLSNLSEKSAKKLAKDLSADAIIAATLDQDGANKVLKFKLFVNGKMKKGFSVKFKNANSKKFKDMLRKKMVEKLDGGGGGGGDAEEEEAPKKPKKAKPELDDEDPNANVKPKKGAKVEKSADKAEKAAKNGKEKGEKEKPEKAEKSEKAEKMEKSERVEKAERSEEAEEEEAPKKAKPTGGDEEEEEETDKGKRTAALGGDEDDEPGVSKRVEVGGGGKVRSANRAALRVDLGVSMLKRTIEFNSTLPPNAAPKPPKLKAVPGGRIDGEIYPLAFTNPDSIAAGLGVGFEYDRTASLKLATSAEPGKLAPTDQYHYAAGLRFRLVGKRPTSPSVTVKFDLGRSRFQPDRSVFMNPASLDVPDTYYKFLAPGVGFRIPLGARLAFFAGAETMLISDAGDIVRPTSYGKASVFGIEAGGGLDILIAKRIGVRLSGEFSQIGFTFQGGGGTQANSRDGDPMSRDVYGAADRGIGGAATVSILY